MTSMVLSIWGGTVARGTGLKAAPALMREPGTESQNHRGPVAKRRVGLGGGLCAWGCCGLWRHKGWETSGSQTPTKTAAVREGKTAPKARAGTARPVSAAPALMREMPVPAHWHQPSNGSTRLHCRCGEDGAAKDVADGRKPGMRVTDVEAKVGRWRPKAMHRGCNRRRVWMAAR